MSIGIITFGQKSFKFPVAAIRMAEIFANLDEDLGTVGTYNIPSDFLEEKDGEDLIMFTFDFCTRLATKYSETHLVFRENKRTLIYKDPKDIEYFNNYLSRFANKGAWVLKLLRLTEYLNVPTLNLFYINYLRHCHVALEIPELKEFYGQ